MKTIFLLLLIFISIQSFAQQMTLEEWNRQAESNIRLLPKYGQVKKTPEQIATDEALIKELSAKGLSRSQASKELIDLGFKYLYRDIKTAMYRFNQAYILDTTNVEIYWGYGGVYMVLGDINRAKEQYQIGLSKDNKNAKILTDLATCYMIDYYTLASENSKKAELSLNTAIDYFTKSYHIDKKYQSTLFKLSVCYYIKEDCNKALKFYDECMKLGGDPVTEEYKEAIKTACK